LEGDEKVIQKFCTENELKKAETGKANSQTKMIVSAN
jgi:hypothetical protein